MTFLNGAPVNTAVHEHENLHAGKEKWKSNFPIVSELVKGMTVFLEKPWTIAIGIPGSWKNHPLHFMLWMVLESLEFFSIKRMRFTFDDWRVIVHATVTFEVSTIWSDCTKSIPPRLLRRLGWLEAYRILWCSLGLSFRWNLWVRNAGFAAINGSAKI